MSVTLKQIAEAVGVSQPLVTYALNGKPGVSDAMRQRILEEADRLGYDRNANRIAQQLAARRHGRRLQTGIIAVIWSYQGDAETTVPAHRSLLDGIEEEAARRELDLFITPSRSQRVPRLVAERGVDGLIFIAPSGQINATYGEVTLPKVTIGAWNPSTYSLVPDGEGGAYQATQHLIEIGHRRIGFIGARHDLQAEARRAGYLRALEESGLGVEPSLIQEVGSASEAEGRKGAAELLKRNRRRPAGLPAYSALLCQNDLLGMGALRETEEHGFLVPEEVSVVGFDDMAVRHQFRPPLSTVAYQPRAMALRAMEWLCTEINSYLQSPAGANGGWEPAIGVEKFPVQLQVRSSSRHWPPDPSCSI